MPPVQYMYSRVYLGQDVDELIVISGQTVGCVLPQPGGYHPQVLQGYQTEALLIATVTKGVYLQEG